MSYSFKFSCFNVWQEICRFQLSVSWSVNWTVQLSMYKDMNMYKDMSIDNIFSKN